MAFRQIFLSLKKSKLLLLLLTVFFLKQLFMVAIFPIFQGPDEPIHYSRIQQFANPKTQDESIPSENMSTDKNPKYSEEIFKTHEMTGAEKISFHSTSTQAFSDGINGPNEEEIKNNNWRRLAKSKYTKEGKIIDYYSLNSNIEKILSGKDIFSRFFDLRVFSVILGFLSVLFIFFSVRKIFDDKISFLFSIIVAFQPMFSQTSAIINYDIAVVFSFSLFIYGAVWALKDNINWKNMLIMIFATIVGILTKAPAIVLPLVFYILIAYFTKKHFKVDNKKFFIYFGIITLFAAILLIVPYPGNYFNSIISQLKDVQFDSMCQSISKYVSVTNDRWSWSELSYWGNFGWLDAEIPSWIVDLAHHVEIIGIVGIFAYLFFPKKTPAFLPERKYVIFFIGMFLALEFAIRFADWMNYSEKEKIGLGTPGRYFLPVIAAQFSLIIIGIGMLARKYSVWKNILKILALSMIMLWVYSVLIIIIPRYYL